MDMPRVMARQDAIVTRSHEGVETWMRGRKGTGAACGDGKGIAGSHVLLAVGRQPNNGDLGWEAAGIRTDARGCIVVVGQCRTSVEAVRAVGDCNGQEAFTHTPWNDHEIVVANLFDGAPRRSAPGAHARPAKRRASCKCWSTPTTSG